MFAFVILLTALTFLIITNSHTLADSHINYCYAEDVEGYICFDTLKECKNEQKHDQMAEGRCYED
jgi:hypothetical protein